MPVQVDLEKCTGCGTCADVCPVEAIEVEEDKSKVNEEECVECGTCVEECPEGALSL
jgi:Fe-S-cluster-containing hydrogenase component 2